MPSGQHKSVSVKPLRVLRIVPQVARPEDVSHRRRAHWHARMAAVCSLNRVDCKATNGVDTLGFE